MRTLRTHLVWLPWMICLGCSAGSGEFDDPGGREEAVTWQASIACEDPREAASALRTFTEDAHGFVSASEERADTAHLRLRVPSTELGSLRETLSTIDEALRLTEAREDVTEAHADLGARLRNQRATEARLLALLDDRTATLGDVLAAERELARVREQIETLETEERALSHRVAMADVEVSIHRRTPSLLDAPFESVASAFVFGARGALSLAVGAAVVLGAAAPSIAVLLVLALVARRAYLRYRAA